MSQQPQTDQDLPEFGIVEDAGNARAAQVVDDLTAAVERGELARPEALVALSDRWAELVRDHPEAQDVTARQAVVRELDPVFQRLGWTRLDPYEF